MSELLKEAVRPTEKMLRKLAAQGECVVICYNRAEVWQSRSRALEFYMEGVCACEGCEAERYLNVVMDLAAGEAVCRDGVSDLLIRPTEYR